MTIRLYLILFLAMVSVSTTAIIIRYVPTVPALTLAFWRMFLSAGFLWLYSYRYNSKITKKNKFRTLIAGIFLGLHFSLFFIGVRNTSVASATLLANTGPLFTAMFSFFNKEKLNRQVFIGLCFATFGVLIVQSTGLISNETTGWGNFVSLLSGCSIAITYMFASDIRKKTENIVYGRSVFFFAAITIALIAFFSDVSLVAFTKKDVPWFVFLALVPSILGHNLLNYAIKFFPPTAIASVPMGEPIIASILSYILFFELVPSGAFWGGPFVFFGIYLIIINSKAN
tara:strand:- start:513 stop:1367 length:855 start_codon:yes stop_codon:yes gene_type:complete